MDGVSNIICCTNTKRVTDLSDLIKRINNSPLARYNGGFIFKIWLDEADKFTRFISERFYPLAEKYENVHCFCLTATPEPLFNKFHYMSVLPLEKTTCDNYHGWQDNKIEKKNNIDGTIAGFVTQIVDEFIYSGNKLEGTKWYIPANRNIISHRMIADILNKRNFAVFIVNGNGLEMVLPNGENELRKKDKELQQQLREMYKKYNLGKYAVAVTGYICVGRGISIMHEEFIFDYGILSKCTKKVEASQNAGRLKGNIKGWKNYKPPTVFTTEKFNKIALELEMRSRELAELAFSKNTIEPSIITKNEFKFLAGDSTNWKAITKEFTSLCDANAYLKKNGCRQKHKFPKNENQFILSSITKKSEVLLYANVKGEMKNWSSISTFDVNKNKNRKQHGRMFICYKDINDINSVVYIVRICKKKN